MDNIAYSEKQLDGIKEAIGIGLNASAETLSKLINNEVNFEVTNTEVQKIKNIEGFGIVPGAAVDMNFSGALIGRVCLMLSAKHIQSILNILMNTKDSDQEFELDEISMDTFKELVNQMCGTFAKSMTNFFGSKVEISQCNIQKINNTDLVSEIFGCELNDSILNSTVKFVITDVMSGFFALVNSIVSADSIADKVSLIPESEDEDILLNAIKGNNDVDSDENSPMKNNEDYQDSTDSQDSNDGMYYNDAIEVQSAQFPNFENSSSIPGIPLSSGNIDLLMDVPLNVTVEIGKTKKKMREIMDFSQGTVIDLEKQAGAPVDIVVNGQLVARGDVVVIDDNFGVRITEIVGSKDLIEKDTQ